MPDDDWQLAQGTVEFRQAERDHANGRDRSSVRVREGDVDVDAAAGVSPETPPAAAKDGT